MSDQKSQVRVLIRRPIDCTPKMIRAFKNLLLSHTDISNEMFVTGLGASERLFFGVIDDKLAGVSCLKYQKAKYHRYLFEQAGVPEMYNPDSVEAGWACVSPNFRGHGVWSRMHDLRMEYIGNRPMHGTHRVTNDLISQPLSRKGDYVQAGSDFKSFSTPHPLRLVVRNHDPIYDPSKGLVYGNRVQTND